MVVRMLACPISCWRAGNKRLTNQYAVATSDLNRAVQVLHRYIGAMVREEYDRIRTFCAAAQARSEASRNELERHIAEHGC